MLKKIIIIVFIIILTACSNEKKTDIDKDKGEYKTLNIEINDNIEKNKDKYLIFLLLPEIKLEELTQDEYYGPIETNNEGKVNIDLYKKDIGQLLDKSNRLKLIVTSIDDIYMKSPLNKDTFVEFSRNADTEYYSTVPNIVVDITENNY